MPRPNDGKWKEPALVFPKKLPERNHPEGFAAVAFRSQRARGGEDLGGILTSNPQEKG